MRKCGSKVVCIAFIDVWMDGGLKVRSVGVCPAASFAFLSCLCLTGFLGCGSVCLRDTDVLPVQTCDVYAFAHAPGLAYTDPER